MELLKNLRAAGVTLTPELNAELRAGLGESVADGRPDEIVCVLTDGDVWRQEPSQA